MDQVYVCTQCGDESDAPGSCQMCGLPLVLMRDEGDDDDDVNLSDRETEDVQEEVSLEEEEEQEEADEAPYDSYDDQDNA